MAKRKRRRRQYRVQAMVDNLDLTRAGSVTRLEIYSNAGKLGTLEIGRGSVRWYTKKGKKPKRISWGAVREGDGGSLNFARKSGALANF
jgi:hypothetical protein